jgi:hypothetical protein
MTSAAPFVIDTAIAYTVRDTTRHIYEFGVRAAMVSDLKQRSTAGKWSDVSRERYTYDGRNCMTSSVSELPVNGALAPISRWTFAYDARGALVSARGEENNKGFGPWTTFNTYTLAYDQQGRMLLEQREDMSGGTTRYGSRNSIIRDGSGNPLVYLYETWRNGWTGSDRLTYTRDIHGNELSYLREICQNGSWINSNNAMFVYDAAGNRLSATYEEWMDGAWMKFNRVSWAYDEQNNRLLTLYEYGRDGVWVNDYRYRDTYENGKLHTEVAEAWQIGGWVPRYRSTMTYAAGGDPATSTTETWDGSTWQNFSRRSYAYDPAGRQTLALEEQWIDGHWVTSYRDLASFHAAGGQTLDQTEAYDSTGQLFWGYRRVNTYGPSGIPSMLSFEEWSNGAWGPGDSWWSIEDSATVAVRYAFTNSTHNLYSFGGYRIELRTTAIGTFPDEPATIQLLQNYPNPFNAGTVISYVLPVACDVHLAVYDLLGRQVARLVDGTQGPGPVSARFDASHLSSGIYFYVLNAGGIVRSQKMLLLR